MTPDLVFVWAGIIAFAILMYVILDGFDLGVYTYDGSIASLLL